MDENKRFILEHKAKEDIEDAASKIGLHMDDYQIIDMAEAIRRMQGTDDEAPKEDDLGGDDGVIVRASFVIGDLAFADHVLDPDKAALMALEAELEADLDHDAIIDAMRDGGDLDEIDQALKDL